MKTHHAPWFIAALVALAALALVIPGSPLYLPNVWVGELDYDGHSMNYWVKALDSPDDNVRVRAVHGLGALGPEAGAAVPTLARIMLEGSTREERIEAALALSKMAPASRTAV